MNFSIAVLMDPIQSINIRKDSTFAMLLAAKRRGWRVDFLEQSDLHLRDGRLFGSCRQIDVIDDPDRWFELAEPEEKPLGEEEAIFMRKDPPFDMEYVYTTYLLERAEREGALVVNRPQSLRDANEKLFTAWFPDCCPPTLVTRDALQIRHFARSHGTIVLKPLDGMGGASVFRVEASDPNFSVVIETLTQHGGRFAMAQRYVPDVIETGDKRILMIEGKPVPYALARIPAAGETRGNLAAGAQGIGVELNDRDRWICERVGPELRRRGLIFVGLDVIGGYLTEINVTSPTCIRELDSQFGLDIAGELMDAVEARCERTRDETT